MRIIFLIFILFFQSFLFSQKDSVKIFSGCASDFTIQNNKFQDIQKTLDKEAHDFLLKKKTNPSYSQKSYSIQFIPVVVHIIHNGGPENINDSQIQTAISNINLKYQTNNGNRIQFCLAQRDPMGNSTNGITRDQSPLTTETMEIDDINLKNINRWPPNCYLNIWIVKEILSSSMGSGVIGYAYFPSAAGSNVDGVVIEAGYFGVNSSYDAVGAHEIGHYLGLYHTFQNACTNNDCLIDGDQVCDTPPDQTTFASCNPPTNSCNTDMNDVSVNNPFITDVPDLSEDYMDYSSFNCYNLFTPGQYDRMEYFLTHTRSSLLGCLSCSSPCPSPVTASITTPSTSITVNIGTTVSFSGTITNSNSEKWYINPNTIISSTNACSYTFNSTGGFWMKFVSISSNPSLCLDGIDSVLINVIQPIVPSCQGAIACINNSDAVHFPTPNNNQYYHNNNGFTWECWVKLTQPFSNYVSTNNFRPIIISIDQVVYEDICLSFGWQGGIGNVPVTNLVFKVDGSNSGTGPSSATCNYNLPGGFSTNVWYHVAGVMDYSNHIAKLYLNGNMVDSKYNNSTPMNRAIQSQISYDNNWNPSYPNLPLGGIIDEVRIWSRPRTDSEISANYNKCLSGNESNLMLYYRCNQLSGTMAQDATSNLYDGTLVHQSSWSNDQAPLTGAYCSIGCNSPCPEISTIKDTSICLGNSIQLNSTGGFTSYTWTPNYGLNNPGINNPIASPTITTKYTIQATYTDSTSQTCISEDSVLIKVTNSSYILNLGNDTSVCNNGIYIIDAGQNFINYHWNDGSSNQKYTAYSPGKYWVTVMDSCGNLQSDTIVISETYPPPLNIMPDTSLCIGDSIQIIFYPINNFKSYQWSPVNNMSCSTCENPYVNPSINTKYYLIASTAEGCTNIDSINISIKEKPDIILPKDTIACSFPLLIDLKYNYDYVSWSNGSDSSKTLINTAGVYHVIVNEKGCENSDSIIVTKYGTIDINVPNVFTPNGDNINDYFELSNTIVVKEFLIYNRWGKLVYNIKESPVKWDGKQSNGIIDDGTYFWIGNFENSCNYPSQIIRLKGFITILK